MKNTELELTIPGAAPLVAASQPMTLVPTMSKAQQGLEIIAMGLKQGITPESLEKLLAMKERLDAKQAEEDFYAARTAFQAESKVILKTVNVDHKYNYAPLDHIVEAVRPLLVKYGFSYAFSSKLADGQITVVCTVHHTGGHKTETSWSCRVTSGTKLMNEPQQDAWSDTFARRYAFTGAFGLVVAGEDKDANSGPKNKTFGRKKAVEKEEPSGGPPAELNQKDACTALWHALTPAANGNNNNWDSREKWLVDELGLDTFDRRKTPPAEIMKIVEKAKVRMKELGV